MIREEAIEILSRPKSMKGVPAEILTAHAMAIKALEQEPCDKCEVGNPCLYCKHEFEPQESEESEVEYADCD